MLTGTPSPDMCQLTGLWYFDVRGNNLTGIIPESYPESIGNCTSFEIFLCLLLLLLLLLLAARSTSCGKINSLHDEGLSFKFTQYNPASGCYADGREKAFSRTERIRSSSLVVDAVSSDKVKMVCGIYQKYLRRKPYCHENALASGESSVVAVLVCGHVFHADCLQERTSFQDRHDPSCPLCSGSPS